MNPPLSNPSTPTMNQPGAKPKPTLDPEPTHPKPIVLLSAVAVGFSIPCIHS